MNGALIVVENPIGRADCYDPDDRTAPLPRRSG